MLTKAIVSTEKEPFSIENINLDEPKENEVLVKIVASGICHTDATVLDRISPLPYPAVLGHEGAGIIEKVGRNITSVEVGDHVVLGFASCGHCDNCLGGNAGACEHFGPLNMSGKNAQHTTPIHTEAGEDVSQFFGQSSFAYYSVADERNVVKVPKDVDLKLLGPLGCGLMTGSGTVLNSLHPEPGSSIVIFGTGAVGLSGLMAGKVSGCTTIIAVDVHDSRLEMAKELGATHTINSMKEDPVEKIREITGGGANYALETTGIPQVILQAIHGLKKKGVMASVALNKGEVALNFTADLIAKGITIKGVIEGDSVPQLIIPKLVEFYKKGLFPFDKLCKFYKFEEVAQAFEDSKNGTTIKPIIVME